MLLLWIGVKLLMPQEDGGHKIDANAHLIGAIKTIVVADAVMSLDNVIAIAAAAKDSLVLVIFGLVVSVPIIVWGSKLVKSPEARGIRRCGAPVGGILDRSQDQ